MGNGEASQDKSRQLLEYLVLRMTGLINVHGFVCTSSRGLQCFKLNGNQTENDRCFYYDPKNFFLEKYQYGIKKNAEFYADFEFVDAGF